MTKDILIENHAIRDITEDTDFKYQTLEWLVGGIINYAWVTIQVLHWDYLMNHVLV